MNINFPRFSWMIFLSVLALAFYQSCHSAADQAQPATKAADLQPTFTPSRLPTPLPTVTDIPVIAPSPTAIWTRQGPGEIRCPILLYHHIAAPPDASSNYHVLPDRFTEQMEILASLGFETISPEQLIEAIQYGAPLPEKPIVITFDDGNVSVYENAFPVMEKVGFDGTLYLVESYINADGFMTAAQINEVIAAGWSIGSHSSTHTNLTTSNNISDDMSQSRKFLESTFGVPAVTLAYPFGAINEAVLTRAGKHYQAAMGLGRQTWQGPNNLFFLYRQEVLFTWSTADLLLALAQN